MACPAFCLGHTGTQTVQSFAAYGDLRLVWLVSDRSVAKLSLQTVIMGEASSVNLRFLTCEGRKCFWERTTGG